MKLTKHSLIAVLLITLLLLPVAHAEETNDEYLYRCAYPLWTSQEIPSWNQWKKALELPGIDGYELSGMLSDAYAESSKITVLCNTDLERTGVEIADCTLIEGDQLSGGKCIIPEALAKQQGLKLGDPITLQYDGSTLPLEICGIYSPGVESSLNDEATPYIFVTEADFLMWIDHDMKNCIGLNAVALKSADDVKGYLESANALYVDDGIKFFDLDGFIAQYYGYTSDEPATTGQQAGLLDGTDLYGNALDDNLLVEDGITMINVWATFCNPCISEMSDLKALSDEYADSGAAFKLIGICADAINRDVSPNDELVEYAKTIVDATGADYLHIIPGQQLVSGLLGNVTAYPTTFFLNDEGEIIQTLIGSRTLEQWKVEVDAILSTNP